MLILNKYERLLLVILNAVCILNKMVTQYVLNQILNLHFYVFPVFVTICQSIHPSAWFRLVEIFLITMKILLCTQRFVGMQIVYILWAFLIEQWLHDVLLKVENLHNKHFRSALIAFWILGCRISLEICRVSCSIRGMLQLLSL